MNSERTLYVERLDHLREEVRQILLGLDEHSLNWRPATGAGSIFRVAQHCAWYEQGMIGHEWGRQPIDYSWPSDESLADADDDASDLLFMLDEAATLTQAVVSAAEPGALDELLTGSEPNEGQPWTPRGLLVRVIEHYAEAIGTMRLTRQVWNAAHATDMGT